MTAPYVRPEQPIPFDQRNILWVLHREVGMHGAPEIPALSQIAARALERKRQARIASRGISR